MSSTPAASADEIAEHGWTAVPRGVNILFGAKPFLHEPSPIAIDEIPFPSHDPIVAKVQQYAKEHLPEPTYNHSMRVCYFGMLSTREAHGQEYGGSHLTGYSILKHQFPDQAGKLSTSTWAMSCLLHDIGTTPSNLRSTLLSFEFYGGILALDLLKTYQVPLSQAEAVAEAIIRHADLGTEGSLSFLGQLIQLATIYDNVSDRPELVHEKTRDAIIAKFPRLGWSKCFATAMREEVALKPWSHTTALGIKFPKDAEGNKLMAPYEEQEK
jgi:cyanamide hydratase